MSDGQEDNIQYLYRSVRTTCTLAAENIAARRYVRLEETRGRGSSQSERDREEGRHWRGGEPFRGHPSHVAERAFCQARAVDRPGTVSNRGRARPRLLNAPLITILSPTAPSPPLSPLHLSALPHEARRPRTLALETHTSTPTPPRTWTWTWTRTPPCRTSMSRCAREPVSRAA